MKLSVESKQVNFLLLSAIFSGLSNLEIHYKWSMSVGENAHFAMPMYAYLNSQGLPEDLNIWRNLFEEGNIATWGKDHECDVVSDDELTSFIISIMDAFERRNTSTYLKSIGLT